MQAVSGVHPEDAAHAGSGFPDPADDGSPVPALAPDFASWRTAARDLIHRGVAPHRVQWRAREQDNDLFSGACAAPAGAAQAGLGFEARPQTGQAAVPSFVGGTDSARSTAGPNKSAVRSTKTVLRLPRALLEMLESAACFRAADRWAFLYQVLWRWAQGERDVVSAADVDGSRLHAMLKAVRREEHDMHAYVRFRERPAGGDAGPQFIAWFEPSHDVLPQVAEHFAKRMGSNSWMLGTPDASVLWDGAQLHMAGPLMRGPADIDDAGEALWLAYYRSIFNPARLNVKVMQSHVPSRFWHNLPEGRELPRMISDAALGARRTGQAPDVGARAGAVIPISAERAQPHRAAPTTLAECRRCALWQNATQAVAGVGPATARIMLVGEQPGDQEDLAGTPFIGPAGKVLERAMTLAGLARASVYLTNAVKHFKWTPRGKRRVHKTPAQQEVMACRDWLEKELTSVAPEVVVALGGTALQAVLQDPSAAIGAHIGRPLRHQGRWVIAVYHPAYVLRLPDAQAASEALAVMAEGFRLAQKLAAGGNDQAQASTPP
jgi:DNA polymerase